MEEPLLRRPGMPAGPAIRLIAQPRDREGRSIDRRWRKGVRVRFHVPYSTGIRDAAPGQFRYPLTPRPIKPALTPSTRGHSIVGAVPGAFAHPTPGRVGLHVMYCAL